MALVLVDQGEVSMLTLFFAGNMTLRLFTNSGTTPAEGDTEGANYTEPVGNGYQAAAITSANWTIATVTNTTTATCAQKSFDFTGAAGNIYGYFVTRDADSKLMFAEKFSDGPYNIVNNGDSVKVTLAISLN